MFYVNIVLGFFVFLGIISYPKSPKSDEKTPKIDENEQNNNKNEIK